jgi:hypothetical protein
MRILLALLSALPFLPFCIQAATVFKCVDADGNINFTQTACPSGQRLDSVSDLIAPPPSGSGDPVRLAEPKPAAPVSSEAPEARAQPPIILLAPGRAPQAEDEISERYRYHYYPRQLPYRHGAHGDWRKPPRSWAPPSGLQPHLPRAPVEPDKPRIRGMPMDR